MIHREKNAAGSLKIFFIRAKIVAPLSKKPMASNCLQTALILKVPFTKVNFIKITDICFHSVNVISFALVQSDHNKRFLLCFVLLTLALQVFCIRKFL